MFEYRRLDQIFDMVSGSAFVPVAKLAAATGVTDRTVRKDIATLNTALADAGAVIGLKRGTGYYLEVQDWQAFDAFTGKTRREADEDLSSAEARRRHILRTLLTTSGYVDIEELGQSVYIGESAAKSYLRQIKDVLERYGLECVVKRSSGVRVFGREIDRRECFMSEVIVHDDRSYATGFSAAEQTLFCDIDLGKLKDIVQGQILDTQLAATDYGLKNLLVHFALMIERIRSGYVVEDIEALEWPADVASFVHRTCDALQDAFGVTIPSSERAYAARHLMTNARVPSDADYEAWATATVDQLLDVIERDYGYDLHADEGLRHGLVMHLGSVSRAIDVGVPVKNPLLETIKKSFPLAYEISLMSLEKVLSDSPRQLSEEDVGYIALHVGAAIERKPGPRDDLLRVLVVCGSGKAAARILCSRIKACFGDIVRVTGSVSHGEFVKGLPQVIDGVSFVVSTVPLAECPLPSVLVGFDLNRYDMNSIAHILTSFFEDRFSRISRFFEREAFQLVEDRPEKDELLCDMCARLERCGVVDERFVASTLERERLADTSMNEVFAIPHTMTPIASRTAVSVAILKHPIKWSERGSRVQIVFLLAACRGMNAEMEHLYELMVRIVNDSHLQRELKEARDYDDFLRVLASAA